MDLSELQKSIEGLNWSSVLEELNRHGYVLISSFLPDNFSEEFKRNYGENLGFRKTVNMERFRFGSGEYKYWNYPLPEPLNVLRYTFYQRLYPLANVWMKNLKSGIQYPPMYSEFIHHCRLENQNLATPLILKYGSGGHNTLHQDIYGKVFFPFQAVLFLSEPGMDYSGGEFVLTQQIPRAQSEVQVLQARKGDLLFFTTQFRPFKGKNGFYRVAMRHGVSKVLWGERYTLGLIFHDALR